jgi:hypothetical protein
VCVRCFFKVVGAIIPGVEEVTHHCPTNPAVLSRFLCIPFKIRHVQGVKEYCFYLCLLIVYMLRTFRFLYLCFYFIFFFESSKYTDRHKKRLTSRLTLNFKYLIHCLEKFFLVSCCIDKCYLSYSLSKNIRQTKHSLNTGNKILINNLKKIVKI